MQYDCFKAKRSSLAGFTMIEILMVIIILSILISTGAPRFGQSKDTLTIRQTALELKSKIAYARRLSVMAGRKIILTIDSENNTIHIDVDIDSPALSAPFVANPKGPLRVPAGYELYSRKVTYAFYPTGQVDILEIEILNDTSAIKVFSENSLGTVSLKFESLT